MACPCGSPTRITQIQLVIVLFLALASFGMTADSENTTEPDPPASRKAGESLDLEMSWWSVDGGGGISQHVESHLIGAIGQPEHGLSTSGSRTLEAGLWATAVGSSEVIFSDGFETGDTRSWSLVVTASKSHRFIDPQTPGGAQDE